MMWKEDSNLTESKLRRLDSNFAKLSISSLENPKFHILLLMMEELLDSHTQTSARTTPSKWISQLEKSAVLLNSQTELQLFWLEETTLEELVYCNQLKNTQDHTILLTLKILQDKFSQPDFPTLSLSEMEKLLLSLFLKDKESNLLPFKKETLDLAEKRKLLKSVKKMIDTIWFHQITYSVSRVFIIFLC